jgi:YD repeat-containing protein
MKRLLIGQLAFLLLLIGMLSTPAKSQSGCAYGGVNMSGGCCTNFMPSNEWLLAVQNLEIQWGGPANCTYGPAPTYGECSVNFYYNSTDCYIPPPAAPAETAPGRTQCPFCTASSPINLITGNTYVEQADIKLPGPSGSLSLSRTWNSVWPPSQHVINAGAFGPNWRSTYEERLMQGDDGTIKYFRSDGSFWSFKPIGLPLNAPSRVVYPVLAPANGGATLSFAVGQAGFQWVITFRNGEQRIFDPVSRLLTAIVERQGNTTQVTYDTLSRVSTVTDPVSRHLYFNYGSNDLVMSVTSDFGISLSYTYDSQRHLTQVTEPDLTTISLSYDSNSMITSVTDSNGKVLESHTYNSGGQGLTASRANSVGAVTVSYGTP